MSRVLNGCIALSLVLNLVLGALLLAGRSAPRTAAPAASPTPIVRAGGPVVSADTWENLRHADAKAEITQLEAAGFPPEVVRAIVGAELGVQMMARRRALTAETENRPFWKNAVQDPRQLQALRQLSREQEKTSRALFGDIEDVDSDPNYKLYQARLVAGLSAEKAADVKRIVREFNDRRQDIYAAGTILPADRAKIAALEKEQRAAIAAALGPADNETFELWNGRTTGNLRYQLGSFNPTEAEFLTIYRLQRPYDDQYGDMFQSGVAVTAEQQRQRSEAQRLLNEQIKIALGPERAADYERSTDFSYQQASRLAERLELPATAAIELWQTQKDILKRYAETGGASPEQNAALAAEAKTKLTALLGPRGFDAYRRNGGEWLRTLEPRPPAKK
jgi:hypothetical protein